MNRYYILEGKTVVPTDYRTWAAALESVNRHVVQDTIGDIMVSTVFLGLDHSVGDAGRPCIFETMIFGGPHDEYCERYSTWEEAEAGHRKALALVQGTA